VATEHGRAYYVLVSRLRRAGFNFMTVIPGQGADCELVLTTREEAVGFRGSVLALEDLDDDPDIVRGQVLSQLDGGSGTLLVGIDPGIRNGMASFYGEEKLAFRTFNSRETLSAGVLNLANRVNAERVVVRVGDGNPSLAYWIAKRLASRLPSASVEIVDESGTSARTAKTRGLRKDEGSAARIALRKGTRFLLVAPE